MEQLAEYQEGQARLIVSRDGDELVFSSDFDDYGKSIVTESRIPVVDYVAKGEGRWPWYDLGQRRAGTLLVLDALGVEPPPWTDPLPGKVVGLFDRARDGRPSIADLLADGLAVDTLDPCGATPLWYAIRSLDPAAALVLIDAGADAGRRVEVSARGERFTTILHEIVRMGRNVALERVLARGVDPSLRDSDGATPMHCLDKDSDHLNPAMVWALAKAGADVDATTNAGQRPIDVAAQRLLPATVATLIDLGAGPSAALTTLLQWWVQNVRWAAYRGDDVVDVIELLRAGGAVAGQHDAELATAAGIPKVVEALTS